MDRANVHIYPSPFKNETRILKITKTLGDNHIFNKIYILATSEDELPEWDALDENRKVIRLPRKAGVGKKSLFWKVIRTVEWSYRIVKFLKKEKLSCINCHSLPVLPLCVFLKLIKRAKLVYDTHELETETTESIGFRRILYKTIERLLIQFVDETIVVNDAFARWYRERYSLRNLSVVLNVPYRPEVVPPKTDMLSATFGIRTDDTLFLYQGILGYARGIDLLLRVFSQADNDKHIIFMGYGNLVELVQHYASQYSNIHYHPAVKPGELIRYTPGADVGICLAENVCLSYYLGLGGNKMFDYLNCGLPIILSNFPLCREFLETYQCGWGVPLEENMLRKIINYLSKSDIVEKKAHALYTRELFGWHLEEPKLFEVYEKMGFSPRAK